MSILRNAVLCALVALGSIVSVSNGKPANKIRGGGNSILGEYPWVVAINVDSDIFPECGGAIIGPRHVVTAAHCVNDFWPSDLIVRGGLSNILAENAVTRHVLRYHVHPDYVEEDEDSDTPIMNDIAILELKKNFTIGTNLLNAIPLPSKQPVDKYAIFTGWGSTTKVPYRYMPTDLQTAVIQLKNCGDGEHTINSTIDLDQYLCGYVKKQNLFMGDSGSPLMANNELIGIASSGYGIRNTPDLYMNVYHYRDWIKSIID